MKVKLMNGHYFGLNQIRLDSKSVGLNGIERGEIDQMAGIDVSRDRLN